MSFQLKDFNSITLSQINHAKGVTDRVTDFQPGSVVRTLMEATAVEVEELYLQMFLGLRDAIPVATFLSFGFTRLPAARAVGYVSVSVNTAPVDPFTINAGTEFYATDGRVYTSLADMTWPAGVLLVRIPVTHSTAGLVGNVSEGGITSSAFFDSDIYTVNNSAITTGRDIETDSERETRFREFVQSLSRGTVSACLYGAKMARILDTEGNIAEYVTRAGIAESAGFVRIYLYSSLGIPSTALLAAGQLIMDGSRDDAAGTITPGYRSAGVRVDVLPMTERAVPLSVQVQMIDGYTLTTAVRQELGDIFASTITAVQPGTTLYLGVLIESMLAAVGVEKIVPVSNSNITCGADEALVAGVLTVTAL